MIINIFCVLAVIAKCSRGAMNQREGPGAIPRESLNKIKSIKAIRFLYHHQVDRVLPFNKKRSFAAGIPAIYFFLHSPRFSIESITFYRYILIKHPLSLCSRSLRPPEHVADIAHDAKMDDLERMQAFLLQPKQLNNNFIAFVDAVRGTDGKLSDFLSRHDGVLCWRE